VDHTLREKSLKKVLEGIRVLDFGRFIAGPFCAALLADFGAEVIRIDRVGGSEDRFIMPVSSDGEGAFFIQVNRNKRSLTLDLDSDAGREVMQRLVRQADVVVANMPPRTLHALGLDYESLRGLKPDIILTASSAFGDQPAVRDRTGFDGTGQAMSGAVHLSGLPGHPMKPMVPMVDFATAMSCALGTVMALYERQTSGQGQEVGASLLRTGLNLASGALIEEAVLKLDRQATGNRSPHYGPSDLFKAKDGWIIVQVIGPSMFKRFVRLIERPELLGDPRFADDRRRGVNGELLSGMMAEWCAGRARDELLTALEQARIPASPVYSPREALDDQVVAAANSFEWVRYPGIDDPVPIVAPPVWLSRTPPAISRPPPTSGQHTDEILREVGYSDQAVHAMRAAGTV
jgi:crotonobetainyl-CoA:carnitine CoA-transferase CaiB-like acyl-CoA transferase